MSLTRLNILVSNSSLTEELKDYVLGLEGDILEIDGLIMNKWDYLEMHQLEPMVQRDPQNQQDINKRLDNVLVEVEESNVEGECNVAKGSNKL